MTDPDRRLPGPFTARRLLGVLPLLVATLPALAQYKIVGPDGKVTYTDRPPIQGRATAVARYPVTLYTASGACDPCNTARQLLRTRGVPFSEKQVLSAGDGDALERLSGARDAPTLAIGPQFLRGLAPEVWGSYLDAAGYPRESRLPPGYVYPPPSPIVERRELMVGPGAAASAGDNSASSAPRTAVTPPAAQGGIKF